MPELQTVDAESLTTRIASLIDADRIGAARPLLVAARRLAPPSPSLALLAALLAMREGRTDLAQAELGAAITQKPDHAGLRKCRAELRHQLGDKAGAAGDAAEAVVLDRHDPSAKALLGVLLLELGRLADAAACLGEAVAADPANPGYREGLAAAQMADGDGDAAHATLAAGIAVAPGNPALRNAATLLAIRHRDFTNATQLAEQACSDGVADARLFGLKGQALSSLGRHAEAADAYAEALKLGPDDRYVRHLVAASGNVPQRCARTWITSAPRSTDTPIGSNPTSYRLAIAFPAWSARRCCSIPPSRSGERLGPALDLGCGTGLVAVALSDLPIAPLVGVDVSPRMLAQAAAKQLYAELHEADLLEMLAEDSVSGG